MNGKKAKKLRKIAREILDIETKYTDIPVRASRRTIAIRMERLKAGLIEDPKSIGAPSTRREVAEDSTRFHYKQLKRER